MSITVSQDAVAAVGNRFDLVLIASMRVRELRNGHRPLVAVDQSLGQQSVALTEIEAGKVGTDYLQRLRKQKPSELIDSDLL
jgi:DNA-directed RNA polymerase subunit omega